MKVFKLNGEVINIGEWDYKLVPVTNDIVYTPQEATKLKVIGRDITHVYDKEPEYDADGNFLQDEGKVVMKITNPLPEGIVEEEQEVVDNGDGGKCLASDYAKLRQYPSIEEQLDYIYHNGVDAWKSDIIQPIKDAHPKV